MNPLASGLGALDAGLGNAVEWAVRFKHRVRLARLHSLRALRPRDDGWWAAGDPPPRDGCQLEVLIDGADAFAAIAEAIRSAQEYVHITGWHISPGFELERNPGAQSLGSLLAEAAERVDVRVLVWAGSPVPVFHPTRSEVTEQLIELTRSTQIKAHADPREHPFHCHHEKTLVIDGHIAFVGGIDMTSLGGDRWDRPEHAARRRLGWHDVHTRLTGPAVRDVAGHFNLRWLELTGEVLADAPHPAPAGGHRVQVVRTVADGMYDRLPRGDFRILESYVRAFRRAERFVYLENQFLWAPELVSLLADKLRHPPSEDFRVVILLPSRANNGQEDTRGQAGVLQAADDGHGRLLIATLRSRSGERVDRLYLHAKVGIVDDEWMTVGSANLNAHSLFNDTEMNVVSVDRELAWTTRLRLWAEHLEVGLADLQAEAPHQTIDARWRPIATEQLARLHDGRPASHRLLALPGVSRRSGRLLGPLTGLVDDG